MTAQGRCKRARDRPTAFQDGPRWRRDSPRGPHDGPSGLKRTPTKDRGGQRHGFPIGFVSSMFKRFSRIFGFPIVQYGPT
eukprot:9061823-Pyramimonas_sp.AAC.1